ncbi:glutamate 5-kinase [Natronogracilivirga saccharolytica]|uniref:glutamate 5-kinase n=1 Tax=Natronogracilivirga saccharolytica TaxID=2812953 RepID=UPI001B316755|nr:glutamate 5-kinase [Natronogracilivirga saccharolytica]
MDLLQNDTSDNSLQPGQHKLRTGFPEQVKRLVIKVGSRVLVDKQGRPDPAQIQKLTGQIASLRNQNYEVILVSSGAIAAGVQSLGWPRRPVNLPDLQMAAAIGQGVLLNLYSEQLARYDCRLGQVLLTHGDLNDRIRHLNARNTIMSMLRNGIIPVCNENDVVAVDEIRFGDNDLLAAMVAALIDADLLVLLTTSNGLFRAENGRFTERIPLLEDITDETLAMAQGKGSGWSSGGMGSKLQSADRAIRSGTPVVIADGYQENVVARLLSGEDLGTLITVSSEEQKLKARKKWIAFFHRPQGSLFVDEGAANAITEKGHSLLPVGVSKVEGRFRAGSLVNIRKSDGKVIARGLTAFDRDEIERIKGKKTVEIPRILGERHHIEIIHRDNMVLV